MQIFLWLWLLCFFFLSEVMIPSCRSGVTGKYDHHGLLHARDDRLWAAQEDQGSSHRSRLSVVYLKLVMSLEPILYVYHGDFVPLVAGFLDSEGGSSSDHVIRERPHPHQQVISISNSWCRACFPELCFTFYSRESCNYRSSWQVFGGGSADVYTEASESIRR